MLSLVNIGRKTFVTAAIIAISCGVTYYADEKRNESQIANLKSQLDSLKNKMIEVRVAQRISDQMGDIASEQTKISMQERDRAEAQKKIADLERGKADMERKNAVEAQHKALASAEQARKSQEEAEMQKAVAEHNELIAREASAKSDTLYHLSLANSLAQSSIVQFNNENYDLARLLALTSYHYCIQYGGNPGIQQNIYESLLNTSKANRDTLGKGNDNIMNMQGNIRKVHILDNGNVAGVTDYGNVFLLNNDTLVAININHYNFRDFYTYGLERNVALCSDGSLIEYNIKDNVKNPSLDDLEFNMRLELPHGLWKRLIGINHGNILVAMSDKKIAWIDGKTMTLIAEAETQSKTTCLGKKGQALYIFCENGEQYVSLAPGQLQPFGFESIGNDKVTSYIYNKEKSLQFLGMYSGKIFVYDENGERVNELLGHDGPVTDMHTWDDMLGSSSYDKTVRIWNINNVNAQITSVAKTYNRWIYTFDINQHNKTIWLGSENGSFDFFCCDAMQNAKYTEESLTREFTPEEWDYYVGKGDEQIYFMK